MIAGAAAAEQRVGARRPRRAYDAATRARAAARADRSRSARDSTTVTMSVPMISARGIVRSGSVRLLGGVGHHVPAAEREQPGDDAPGGSPRALRSPAQRCAGHRAGRPVPRRPAETIATIASDLGRR